MSDHSCRPVVRDMTGMPLPAEEVHQAAVAAMWTTTTPREREAYHRACCLKGGSTEDRLILRDLEKRMKAAIDETPCCRAAIASVLAAKRAPS